MAVAETRNRQSAKEIKVAIAVGVVEIGAVTARERERRAAVGV